MNRPFPSRLFALAGSLVLLGGCATRPPCELKGLPLVPAGAPPLALTAPAGGGTFVGSSGAINTAFELDVNADSLTIVVENDLDVNADVLFPDVIFTPDQPAKDIVLVSLGGRVLIKPGVRVGDGRAAPGSEGNPGLSGVTGGRLELRGVTLDIGGQVIGNQGGLGGRSNFAAGMTGGGATRTGGPGGAGGAVHLCALESIAIRSGAEVRGGGGGLGGSTNINADGASSGTAGHAGAGSNVAFQGTGPAATPVGVTIDGLASGGRGGAGGRAAVTAADPADPANGANATAVGGDGGMGGSVNFTNAVVMRLGTVVAGDGGNAAAVVPPGVPPQGVSALAQAGFGEPALIGAGNAGGNATATGGNGGPAGAVPRIPTPAGIVDGAAGTPGSGGDAVAYAGNGGVPGLGGNTGGASGTGTARGGRNGAGAGPAAPAVSGPAPAAGAAGGATAPATQAGTR
jgi:hypothetical protein